MQVISHTFPGGAQLCAYLHEADESMPASLRCEHPALLIFPAAATGLLPRVKPTPWHSPF